MRQREAQRNEYYHFAKHGEKQCRFGSAQCHIDVLQRHLHEKHDRPHQEKRRIPLDDLQYRFARGKQIRIDLRERHGNRPHHRRENKRNDRHATYAAFQSGGIAFAVVVTHKRLHSVPESVERQRDQLQRAQHYRERGGVVFVPARRGLDINIEHYLYGTFRYSHYERRQPQSENGKYSFAVRLHRFHTQAEYAFLCKEENHDPHERQKLRDHRREARAFHAHIENKNKQRVQRNICQSPDQHREHGDKRMTLRGYKRIQALRRQHENSPRGIDLQIRLRVVDRAFGTAEKYHDLSRGEKRDHAYYHARNRQQDKRRVEYFVRLVAVALAEFHARARRAAKPYQIRECLYDKRYRQNNAECRQCVHARPVYFRNVHSVYDVIQKRYQLRYNGGNGQLENQRQYFLFFQFFGRIHKSPHIARHNHDLSGKSTYGLLYHLAAKNAT